MIRMLNEETKMTNKNETLNLKYQVIQNITPEHQAIAKTIEELNELATELARYLYDPETLSFKRLSQEIADVKNVVNETVMRFELCDVEINQMMHHKLDKVIEKYSDNPGKSEYENNLICPQCKCEDTIDVKDGISQCLQCGAVF